MSQDIDQEVLSKTPRPCWQELAVEMEEEGSDIPVFRAFASEAVQIGQAFSNAENRLLQAYEALIELENKAFEHSS